MKSAGELLEDILIECDYLSSTTARLTLEDFLADETAKRAFARSLEIIGEAVKGLPSDIVTRWPEIPWRRMAGMRDRLIHGYLAVDYSLVWDVAVNHIPQLREGIAGMGDRSEIGT